ESDLVASSVPTMRNPLSAIFSNTPVALYTGSQYQGAGNPGNQLANGSTIFYKKSTDSNWNSLPMFFYKAGTVNTQNKYYSNPIHGGDFRGVQQKLDYVKALGATAIWISPVVRNTTGNYAGYSGWNFYALDPHWGTMDDLTNMISAAHARGIRVILDIVCNHG